MPRNERFVIFDPVNNDPHFLELLAAVFATVHVGFKLITSQRSNFLEKMDFVVFLPGWLTRRFNPFKKVFIFVCYVPCLIRVLFLLRKEAKPIIFTSSPWFPLFDAFFLFVLSWMGKDVHVLVHMPSDKRGNVRRSLSIFFRKEYRYICLCHYSKNVLVSRYGIPEERVTVVYHPNFNVVYDHISIEGSITEELEQWKNGRTLFLYMSGITENHGIRNFSEIIEDISRTSSDFCFLFCGNYKNKHQATIASEVIARLHKFENVRIILKHYSPSEASSWLAVSDAVVLPYKKIYQSGVQFLALGRGVPVIVTDVGGLPEIVTNDWNGVVIKKNTRNEWEEAFNSVRNRSLADHDTIRHDAELRFGAKRIAKEYMTCLTLAAD